MKAQLRRHFISLRSSLSEETRQKASRELTEKIERISKSYDFVASFSSFGSEIDLKILNQKLALQGKLLLPKRHENILRFYLVKDLSALEPAVRRNPGCQSDFLKEPQSADQEPFPLRPGVLLLVPGLVFSSDLCRLGYGKGFYDRLISEWPSLHSIGVGFLSQLFSGTLPQDHWDRKINQIILT